MLLVIDVGNTNIVAGVFDDKELVCHWRFSTDRSKTADEYGILLRSMFNYTRMPMDQIKAIIISSVGINQIISHNKAITVTKSKSSFSIHI